MGDSKSRYEVSRALMNTLPAIKEESFHSTSSGGTPRNVQTVRVNNRPILIQTLPPDPRKYYEPPPPTPRREPEPVLPEDDQDIVDQVVEDYLHYARYSAAIPVKPETWDSDEPMYCSCCKERNRENIRRQHGLPPEKPDYPSPRKADASEEEPTTSMSQRSPRSFDSTRQSWMNYQPLPYAKTYLNPEFNRPSVVYEYQNALKGDDETVKTKAEVLESNTRFDQAMKKLKFTTQKLDPNFDETHMSFS